MVHPILRCYSFVAVLMRVKARQGVVSVLSSLRYHTSPIWREASGKTVNDVKLYYSDRRISTAEVFKPIILHDGIDNDYGETADCNVGAAQKAESEVA